MSKREFVIGAPMRHTVNSAQTDAALERIAAKVSEMIAPTIAQAVANEMKTNASSNGRKLSPDDLVGRYTLPADDDYDTLPGDEPAPADQYELPD